ncbi:DUF3134 family protein [Candidatus Cyanaurora vandensis]|uniref:DUF3134 family protein n=1 Tax=Candidatus Cyanaurora vandensis TaxID=2714958 RepID=UPI00257AD499|nr:DUF3134 family protein [Candidatus Cyanaurora vandensis]
MRNPTLREEPRYEKAAILPMAQRESILEWLQSKGRVVARQNIEMPVLDEEEIEELFDEETEDTVDVDED